MNICESTFNFNTVNNLIARARLRGNLTETENGLLNVAANAAARAGHGADVETLRCLITMAEKIEAVISRRRDNLIPFPGHFHRYIGQVAPQLKRKRWNGQVGIEVREAA